METCQTTTNTVFLQSFSDARTGCIESKEIKVNQKITKSDGSFETRILPSVMPNGMAFQKGSLGGGFKILYIFHPDPLGKWHIFLRWFGSTTNFLVYPPGKVSNISHEIGKRGKTHFLSLKSSRWLVVMRGIPGYFFIRLQTLEWVGGWNNPSYPIYKAIYRGIYLHL